MRNLLLVLAWLLALAGWASPQPVSAEISVAEARAGDISSTELVRCEAALEEAKVAREALRDALESPDADAGIPDSDQLGPPPSLATVADCRLIFQQMIDHPFASLFNKPADHLDDWDAYAVVDISRYYADRQNSARLEVGSLEGILKDLPVNTVAPSIWERLWLWLRELVGSEVQEAPAWLEHLVPSEAFLEGFLYVVGVLLIVSAIVVVIVEVRRGRRHRRSYHLAKQRVEELLGKPPLSMREVQEASLQTQPSLLLAYILQELVEQKEFSLPEPLTHRGIGELDLSAHCNPGADLSALREISMAAERATYGMRAPSAAETRSLLDLGQVLLRSLGLQEGQHG